MRRVRLYHVRELRCNHRGGTARITVDTGLRIPLSWT